MKNCLKISLSVVLLTSIERCFISAGLMVGGFSSVLGLHQTHQTGNTTLGKKHVKENKQLCKSLPTLIPDDMGDDLPELPPKNNVDDEVDGGVGDKSEVAEAGQTEEPGGRVVG